jgi:hypothetical protein
LAGGSKVTGIPASISLRRTYQVDPNQVRAFGLPGIAGNANYVSALDGWSVTGTIIADYISAVFDFGFVISIAWLAG